MANIQAGSDGAANEEMTAQRLNVVDWMAMILLIVGGLNWALVGRFDIDIVARILGAMLSASRGVYVLVGGGRRCIRFTCACASCPPSPRGSRCLSVTIPGANAHASSWNGGFEQERRYPGGAQEA